MTTFNIGKIKTSTTELKDIAKAWIIISLAFTFVFSGASLLNGGISKVASLGFFIYFIIALGTAGIGFLLHEMAHKLVAQHFGCEAEFRAYNEMLYIALGLAALIGFLFAAPGAVMISGLITRRENGIISIAGPATNYILASIFLGLTYLLPQLAFIFTIGLSVNLWLGLFNMIPFGNFDGLKIFYWNKIAWGIMVILGAAGLYGLYNF